MTSHAVSIATSRSDLVQVSTDHIRKNRNKCGGPASHDLRIFSVYTCSMAEESNDDARPVRSDASCSKLSRPWLSIPLNDYEGHMNAPEVGQLPILATMFEHVLKRWRPESVAIAGVAGGNGLGAIDCSVTKRIVGIDINQEYLEAVEQRFRTLPGLELHHCDLTIQAPEIPPVAIVHAALLFEHTGVHPALDHVLSLVDAPGKLSVVLQMSAAQSNDVAVTKYTSLQSVKQNFALVELADFRREMAARRFHIVDEEKRLLPGGKAFWIGVFQRHV